MHSAPGVRVLPILLLAAGVAHAEPDEVSGRIDPPEEDGALRYVGRGLLLIPRGLIELVALPFDGALYAFDRYHVDELYHRAFYFDDDRFAILPAFSFETGFGAAFGVKFQSSDLFGDKEHLLVQGTTGAVFGVTYREGVRVKIDSGNRLGSAVKIGLDADFDRRPDDPFYGIGNGDLHDEAPAMPVDARTDEMAYKTYHRFQEERAALAIETKPASWLHVNLLGALTRLRFGEGDQGIPLEMAYAPETLVGYNGGVEHAYTELALAVDTRASSSEWEPEKQYTRGSLAAIYAGRVTRLDEGKSFFRYGAELQHFFKLADGPRVLIFRARAEGVSGSRDEVPFTEFPMLGGGDYLRGYDYARFRDRATGLASLQYEWDLSKFLAAYVFTDAGRVWDSFQDVTLSGLRVGYGIGIEARGKKGFLMSASLASSIDGGILVSASFNQVVDARPRWR